MEQNIALAGSARLGQDCSNVGHRNALYAFVDLTTRRPTQGRRLRNARASMIIVWVALMIGGLAVSGLASDKALTSATNLGLRAGLSPFVIGLTVVSVGTDLPEIANSISAAAQGRGDVNVGDSTGSAATQITFVLSILCFIAVVVVKRSSVAITGTFTVAALLLGAALMSDGQLSHLDGAILVVSWVVLTAIAGYTSRVERTEQPELFSKGVGRQVSATLVALAAVGAGAAVAVSAFGRISDSLDVPEYATSFFVLSLGTSLPELLVAGKAARQGNGGLALGDVLGSSLADSTLSLGAGPLLFSTDVSESAADGTLIVAGIVAAAVVVLLVRKEHRWPTGLVLMGLYLAMFPLLIGG